MTFAKSTRRFETWLRAKLPNPPGVDEMAIAFKHEAMKGGGSAFPFLRATFYRWADRWAKEAGGLADATPILCVGDLHLENFGTWRDADGHLIWGINDFDEAWEFPWPNDLVRLGVSASLAARQDKMGPATKDLCQFILEGYESGIKDPTGSPFDLDSGHHPVLRKMARKAFKSAAEFWADFEGPLSKWKSGHDIPKDIRAALESALPPDAVIREFRAQEGPYQENISEPSGLGSLGRPRYCLLAQIGRRRIVREAKILLPSAASWAAGFDSAPIKIGKLLKTARRLPDPYFRLCGPWAVRRIAPDTVKINRRRLMKAGFKPEERFQLYGAMGRETANLHLGSGRSKAILRELKRLRKNDPDWLFEAVKVWRQKVEDDWQQFDPKDV